ncbi:MAG: cysteine desulfurase NifS [Clostridia bacterium]|nr:cysteine desulfurase NifS [Clostridia bacterium]
MRVYADNAATTPISERAKAEMIKYMDAEYENASSLHTYGQSAAAALAKARERIATLIGAEAGEIYFTSGGSEADNQAIISAAHFGAKKNKKHIISTAIEHHAVLHTLERLEKEGYRITLLPVDENGLITAKQVEDAICEDTCLVTVMFANNEIGTIMPVEEIGKICREKKVYFHTDAVQAVGHVHINVREMGIDMLSLSAHKFHGPKGIGALFVRRGVYLEALISGGAQEKGKRAGTENVPAIMGMAAAMEDAVNSIDENAKKLTYLRDKLIDNLSKVERTLVNGDRVKRLPANVNMCFEGIEGESLLLMLDMYGIAASSGSACTSGSLDPSHVLIAIGRPHAVAHGSLRLSLSEYTTEEEVDYIIECVPKVVERLREMSPVWERILNGEEVK